MLSGVTCCDTANFHYFIWRLLSVYIPAILSKMVTSTTLTDENVVTQRHLPLLLFETIQETGPEDSRKARGHIRGQYKTFTITYRKNGTKGAVSFDWEQASEGSDNEVDIVDEDIQNIVEVRPPDETPIKVMSDGIRPNKLLPKMTNDDIRTHNERPIKMTDDGMRSHNEMLIKETEDDIRSDNEMSVKMTGDCIRPYNEVLIKMMDEMNASTSIPVSVKKTAEALPENKPSSQGDTSHILSYIKFEKKVEPDVVCFDIEPNMVRAYNTDNAHYKIFSIISNRICIQIIFFLLLLPSRTQTLDPTIISTSQIFAPKCKAKISNAWCLSPVVDRERWKDINRICCQDFSEKENKEYYWSCQQGTLPNGNDYIIQACMKKQTALPGEFLNLTVSPVDSTPEYIKQECQEGHYEDEVRDSYMILRPECSKVHQKCNSDGQMLKKQGSTTSDNICICLPHAIYLGNEMKICAHGFDRNSECSCSLCDEGYERSEDNRCVQVGHKSSFPSPSSDSGMQDTQEAVSYPTTTQTSHKQQEAIQVYWIVLLALGLAILLVSLLIIFFVFCTKRKKYSPTSQEY